MQTGTRIASIERPETTEYNPYYEKYVSLITEANVLDALRSQTDDLRSLLGGQEEEKGGYAYEIGKWTVKEVLSHLLDGERIFAYRVLRISRGDETPIEGFEQDGYIENSYANDRTFADLIGEFAELRAANIRMMQNLREADWLRLGTASGSPVSVRALAYIMAGHIRHHLDILNERYFA